MIIRGNTVGTTMPRADYAETNPKSAAYIKNKPDEAIQKAQKTADAALPKTGGDVTGDINMSGNIAMNGKKITGVATPSDDGDAANKKYVDDEVGKSLPKSGGTMTGNIVMGGKQITELADPTENAHAANKGYVDGKHEVFTTTLTANDWEGDAAPYTQIIGIEGILSTDRPHVCLIPSDDAEVALIQEEHWGFVSRGVAYDGYIVFTCYEDKPEINLTLQIEVNR